MTRLILHIGDHKTGTSAIQRALAGGAAGPNVLYPETGRVMGSGHQNLAWEVGEDPRFNPEKGDWSVLAAELACAQQETTIISAEAFEFKDPKASIDLIRVRTSGVVTDLGAIVYIRPHAARILSSFGERVKRGIGPFDRTRFLDWALKGDRFLYLNRLEKWRAALAPGRLMVRVFTRDHLTGGDAVNDFCMAALGLGPATTQETEANVSPTAAALRLMQIQGAAFEAMRRPDLARRFARQSRRCAEHAYPNTAKPSWRRAEAERIARATAPDALALDRLLNRTGDFGPVFSDALHKAGEASIPDIGAEPFSPETEAALITAAQATARALVSATGGSALQKQTNTDRKTVTS
ncbi:MAG: hypothetical protein ACPGGK_17300 [Pikeienuella sp.]